MDLETPEDREQRFQEHRLHLCDALGVSIGAPESGRFLIAHGSKSGCVFHVVESAGLLLSR